MPAVNPRARVRLRAVAVAVALTVSSSLIVGIGSAPAQAAGPTSAITFQPVAASKAKVVTPAKKKAPRAKVVKHKVVKHKVTKKVTKKVTRKVTKKTAAPKLAFGTRVIRVASAYRGTPYQYGATGPSRFDCSGFTRYIFAKFGISLAHSSSAQYSEVRHIANRNKQVGDLVF
ncbi:MAG: hypothetical protein QOE76_2956, partial [Frankiales bacterium]|nr:hypothetical protein [Frankiales bacterium]